MVRSFWKNNDTSGRTQAYIYRLFFLSNLRKPQSARFCRIKKRIALYQGSCSCFLRKTSCTQTQTHYFVFIPNERAEWGMRRSKVMLCYHVSSTSFKRLLKTHARVVLVHLPRGAALPTIPGCVTAVWIIRETDACRGEACPSQQAVFGLVQQHDLLAAAAVFAQLGHFLSQRGVFSLQEGSADGDLVLFQTPGFTRTLCCHVVLLPPRPVFLILRKDASISLLRQVEQY